jgi:hypothetical protein
MRPEPQPGPSGPPIAAGDRLTECVEAFAGRVAEVVIFGSVAAVAVGVVAALAIPTLGATRSTRLRWQEQKRQAERAEIEPSRR